MCALATLLKPPNLKEITHGRADWMIPALGNEADQILVLEQKVEEMKSKGWTVVGDKPTPPKPKAKKETD